MTFRFFEDDLPLGTHLLDEGRLIVHRSPEGCRAALNRCQHMGGRFILQEGVLRCPKHGWQLDPASMRYVNPRGALVQPEIELRREEDGSLSARLPEAPSFEESAGSGAAQTLQAGEWSLTFLAHACGAIRGGDDILVTDPWLQGPAFSRGWWLAHRPPRDWLTQLLEASALFISHDHSDHLNAWTLRPLAAHRPDIPIYFPRFVGERVGYLLRRLGFQSLIPCDFGRWYTLKGGMRLMALPDAAGRDDSALLVDYRGHRLLNTVDCRNPNGGVLPSGIDVLLSAFAGGASGYPICWTEMYDEEEIQRRIRRNLLSERAMVGELIEKTRPALYVPFAGYFVEAHPSDSAIRERNAKNSASELAAWLRKRYPELQLWCPSPGERMDLARGELQPYEGPLAEPEGFEPYLEEISRSMFAEVLHDRAGLQRYFDWAAYRGDLVLHVLECDETMTQTLREFFVDFRDGQLKDRLPKGDVPYQRMRVRAEVFRHVLLEGSSWEEISIGFQARFYREPDIYHLDFWNHFQSGLPLSLPYPDLLK